jgi:thymidine phosphorylase
MIWEYRVPLVSGTRIHYGTPVSVFIEGLGYKQLVYQYGSPSQRRAVVDLRSGRVVAPIEDTDRGHITEVSQAAVSRAIARLGAGRIIKAFQNAAVINNAARVVWTRP